MNDLPDRNQIIHDLDNHDEVWNTMINLQTIEKDDGATLMITFNIALTNLIGGSSLRYLSRS